VHLEDPFKNAEHLTMNDISDQPSREFIAQHIAGSGRPAVSLDAVFDAAFEQGSPGSSDPEKYVRKILHRAKEMERERMAAEVRIKAGRAFHVELLGPDRRILRLRVWPSESIDTIELNAVLELNNPLIFFKQVSRLAHRMPNRARNTAC
jgi:hypothetical protein